MNIVFLGSGAFGVPTLEQLAAEHTITGIVTQPDRRVGRGKNSTPTPIGQWAAEHLPEVPIAKPEKINTDEARDMVRNWESDAWVVIAYGQYLGSKLIADRFAINLHGSRLPRWRGAAPINAAIVAGDAISGNSVITIAKEMDAGYVLGQSERLIESTMTASELHHALSLDGPDLVMQILEDHAHGRVQMAEQDAGLVTAASKMLKSDGWIDFVNAVESRCRINGLSPWPCVAVEHRSQVLKILRAQSADTESQEVSGTIVDAGAGIVACGVGTLQLLEVQPAGKKPMSWQAYANGRQVKDGEMLIGRNKADPK
ncbi:MAG: methionyl-tRNA formyltransferase [Phycisphaerales bacterium]|nr:methionyl-tRNA formyltransferase [Phycisphaerales bacterium]